MKIVWNLDFIVCKVDVQWTLIVFKWNAIESKEMSLYNIMPLYSSIFKGMCIPTSLTKHQPEVFSSDVLQSTNCNSWIFAKIVFDQYTSENIVFLS